MRIQELLESIEEKRSELVKLGLLYGLSSPVAIKESQELDKLLNNYQKIKEEINT